MRKTIARNITLDHATGDLIIDDLVVPFHIHQDVEIEVDPDSRTTMVTVSFPADAVHVSMSHESAIAHIRAVANQHRLELGLKPLPDADEPVERGLENEEAFEVRDWHGRLRALIARVSSREAK